ncbi:YcxB family protein [Maribacter sp. BPC-D8]|uniref:YcxB family protein n=1 Tax=Maribacter sp. BPC-D8 TaxID=3053613 RepID=UPI002B467A9E|nr:YcxB family protein [Maribacter sp. BPC-D8]WRI30066.1 YcxB family protein [Maribacter sp. BPC-D8]
MKLEYILERKDFMEYLLFSAWENKKSRYIKNILKFFIISIFVYAAINAFNKENIVLSIVFGVFAVLVFTFFGKVFNSKLKKQFSEVVDFNYSKRIGEKETIEFSAENMITEDKNGIGKFKISDIEKINETQNNFFIKLLDGSSVIVSKNGIENSERFKNKFKELNIPIVKHLSRKW